MRINQLHNVCIVSFCLRVHVCVHMYVCMFIYILFMCVFMCVHIYLYMCTCVFVCVCVWVLYVSSEVSHSHSCQNCNCSLSRPDHLNIIYIIYLYSCLSVFRDNNEASIVRLLGRSCYKPWSCPFACSNVIATANCRVPLWLLVWVGISGWMGWVSECMPLAMVISSW